MKRKSSRVRKATVSYETESDHEEFLDTKINEDSDAIVDSSNDEVEAPKEKKRRTKGKTVESDDDEETPETQSKRNNSPQRKIGRSRKSRDIEKSRSDKFKESNEGEEDDSDYQDESKRNNSPQKKGGRGRKSNDLEKSRSDKIKEADEEEDDSDDEDQSKRNNSPQKKVGRGRKSKDLEKSRSDKIKEADEDEEDDSDDEKNSQKNNSSMKNVSRGRKSKDVDKSRSDEIEASKDADEEEENSEYEVEKIIDEKMIRGKRHFLIRWKGYGADSDTWEPAASLNCPEALEIYKKTKGTLAKNSPIKAKQNKKKIEYEEKWDENENFEVVRILDVYFRKDGKREFLVAWKGYSQFYNSWEPEENMDCKDLITNFLKKCDSAKQATQKELRVNRKITDRFTLSTADKGRRLSRRNKGSQRVQYHDAE